MTAIAQELIGRHAGQHGFVDRHAPIAGRD
jgi:hypothetical protein